MPFPVLVRRAYILTIYVFGDRLENYSLRALTYSVATSTGQKKTREHLPRMDISGPAMSSTAIAGATIT